MQIFNEINARMLQDEVNVFSGICNNPIFIGIWVGTMAVQVVATQFGGAVFKTTPISWQQWLYCLAFSTGNLFFGMMVKGLVNKDACSCGCISKEEYTEKELEDIVTKEESFIKSSFMRKSAGANVGNVLSGKKKNAKMGDKDGFSASGDYTNDPVWPSTTNIGK